MTRLVFNEGTDKEEIPSYCKVMKTLTDGETFTIYTGGGNDYGPPEDRDPEKLKRDVLDGKVSS